MEILDQAISDEVMISNWMEATNAWLRDLTYQLEKSSHIVYQPITEPLIFKNELDKLRERAITKTTINGTTLAEFSTLLVIWWNVDYYSDPHTSNTSKSEANISRTWVVEEQYWRDCLSELGDLNCDYEWFHALAVYNPMSGEFFPMNTSHFPNLRECVNQKYPASITTTLVLPSGEWQDRGFTQ